MEVAYISAVSALAGSVVGGITSGFTTWLSQRTQVRAARLKHELSRREQSTRISSSQHQKPMAMRW